MEQSYLEASANGTLPTRPRQVFYRARPQILEATGAENLDGQYFAQTHARTLTAAGMLPAALAPLSVA